MTIKNIIFDFDGTLADTSPVILATMKATMRELGVPIPDDSACLSTIGLRLCDVPERLFPERDISGSVYAEVYQQLFRKYNTPGSVRLFDGVEHTLNVLKSRGFHQAIASSRSRQSINEYLATFGIAKLFEKVIGANDVVNGKPAPDPVYAITEPLNWKTEETIVVGDASVDIIMGRRAGTQTCGVTYGNGTIRELTGAGAGFIMNKITDLPNII